MFFLLTYIPYVFSLIAALSVPSLSLWSLPFGQGFVDDASLLIALLCVCVRFSVFVASVHGLGVDRVEHSRPFDGFQGPIFFLYFCLPTLASLNEFFVEQVGMLVRFMLRVMVF